MHPRERRSLDGTWSFWPDREGRLAGWDGDRPPDRRELVAALGEPRAIAVPGVWQAQFGDLRLWAGEAWYARTAPVPAAWQGRRVLLRFGAVDYACTVWANGRPVGAHEGGYLPFTIDVTDAVRAGDPLELVVRVVDLGPDADAGGFRFAEIPHGKQSWYGPLGGIWQSVVLEASAAVRVERLLVDADRATATASVHVRLSAPAAGGERLAVSVAAPERRRAWTAPAVALEPGSTEARVRVPVDDPEPWAPGQPRLYTAAAALADGERTLDRFGETFGFRTVEARDGRVWLNGRPILLRGALDQDYYHGTIATPPSDDLLREQVLRARELGLNLLRCHIKVPDPRYLDWCDRLGMLVWAELPNWAELTDDARRRAWETLAGVVERDWNRPSIVIWTVLNESWGADLAGDADHRRWVAETYRRLKRLDPSRLAVDNSACVGNFHVESDLNDFHRYHAIPDGAGEWTAWLDRWEAEPAMTYSPHGDAVRRGGEPLVVSEFGNWGLPDPDRLRDDDGRDPWWFATGAGWDGGAVRPEGIHERYEEWGLDEVFGDFARFVAESQWHEWEALRFEITDLRRRPATAGYVVTELTDVHWECNGLLDLARNPKAFHARFTEVNAADAVLLAPRGARWWSGDEIAVDVWVSHWSRRDLDGCGVRWRAGEDAGGALASPAPLPPGSARAFGVIRFTAPAAAAAARVPLRVELRDRAGRLVNRATRELLVLPRPAPAGPPGAPPVRVAERLDADVASHVRAGGRAVILVGDERALPDGLPVRAVARAGRRYAGDWAQGLTWLRPELTDGLAVGPRLGADFAGLAPAYVLLSYGADRRRDVLAALYLGWLRETTAVVAAFRLGAGAGILCALPLGGRDDDPLATALLTRVCALAAAPALAPATDLGDR
jgi:hypothetical protein